MRTTVVMDGFSWLIISWVVVGALCYFALNKLGTPQPENGVSLSTESSAYSTSASRSQTSEWTNDLLRWLFNNLRRVPEPLEAWISSLNEAAKKVSSPSTCEILFEGFADNSNVRIPPKVSNIHTEQGPKDHLTMKSTIDVPEVNLKLVSSQRVEDRLIVSNFDAKIRDLHGEVSIHMWIDELCYDSNQIYVMACFSGRPELEIQLTNTDSSVVGEVNSTIVEAAIRRCLVSAVTNVSLSDALSPLNTTTTSTPTSPITPLMTRNYRQQSAERSPIVTTPTSQIVAPVQEMIKRLSQSQHMTLPTANISNQFSSAQPNKVRVKVVRAQRLGKEIGKQFRLSVLKFVFLSSHLDIYFISIFALQNFTDVNQPYVVVEMDEPAQKYTTTKGLNMSPYWEETFDFDFTPASEEILFEIYEGEKATHDAEPRFLGLAIVGFEEIRRSGESVHSFTLQGRPYRNDSVSGTLTVQFDFYHDPNVSIMGQQVDQVIVHGNDGSEFRETLMTSRRPIYDPHDSLEGRDLIPTKTTTVTVKGVSQQFQQLKDKPLISSVHSSMESPMDPVTPRTLEPTFQRAHTDEGYDSQRYDGSTGLAGNQTATTTATTSLKQTAVNSMSSVPAPASQTTTTITATQQHSPTYQVPQQTIRSQQQPQPGKTAQLIQISHHPKDSSIANEQGKVQTQAHYPSPTYQEQRAVLANKVNTTSQQQSTPLTPTDDPTRISRELFISCKFLIKTRSVMVKFSDRFKKPTVEGEVTSEKRERSFFGELRDRLSGRRRSKRRAKSFDLGNEELEEAVSLPPSRDQSRTRNKDANWSQFLYFFKEKHISRSHHETSSVGEKSGISSKSLYQHSTLVLETTKDGKKRYYLIPPSIVDEPAAARLMKHGKKLHIYNDHIFVAVKLRGGTTCNVCHHRIARSFAKQAYQCRDCRLVCHKTCHYKTESYCTASTVSKLDISKDVDWPHFLQHYEFEEFISSDGV
ncbi:unnamed protein product [Anisakis simplex]|uniref:Protein kinase C-like 3 n=1 Tax=Anisakis simplex TaxID=6269 RepID=A0A3P6RF88_ANISI|nr:unnamed protein product [Anisakis simplex]